ncbi:MULTISPECIES: VCBS domain-containing protein [unclassified Mesorhizobium]|uniref:beta strand repeat-containing protein n=2 Tax=Mesorhizobium TaxID=68287 RepID=UPI000FCA59D6|nr:MULTISPECIES: VCBS domain-containing protein [unclassified Mesorhizobium]RUU22958.1 adhesin [Mesorhizobium sp. Primo-B]RUU38305.1 adhesin [Mesorhizobium sp. Primo-A]RUX18686.1 adhesin [Mesorhizobium sp. M7A.F.Ca.CA.002.14.1.2]RUX63334.1 adhesin [Mesorhizobium sp. M7A.F.Ca.CA.002.12.1.1]
MATQVTGAGGTTTSFSNTPQAKDDLFTYDSFQSVFLNVMANDLGGNAKTLWSVDNGINNTGAMNGYTAADLLTQDLARTESPTSETSYNGAKIWITSDGLVGYDATTLSAAFKAQLQGLNAGQYLTDSFIYSVRLGNGTLSWATATVHFAGTNDAAVISGVSTGAVVEAGGVANAITGTPTVSGTLTDTDVDNTPNTFQAVAPGTAGDHGYGTYQMTAGGVWTFTLNNNNAAVQGLNVGQHLTETFTVHTQDGTAQVVTVTINGTNDAAVISGTIAGTVVEAGGAINGTPSVSGTLTDTDVDNLANTFQAVGAGGATDHGYGTFAMNAAGTWTYTLDNTNSAVQELNAGDHLIDTFTVRTADGTAQVVTVTINGITDNATVNLSASTVAEGAVANYVFTATLSDASHGVTTITTDKGDITIADGQTTGTLTIASGNGEDVYNDASSLTANITATAGGNFEHLVIGTGTATANVTDTTTDATVNLSASTVAEGAVANYVFTATLSDASHGVTTITTDKGDITIADGQTTGTLTIASGNGEDVYNDASSLTANITATAGGNFEHLVIGTGTATANVTDTTTDATVNLSTSNVTDHDTNVTFTATLSNASQGVTTVHTDHGDITIANGQTVGTLVIATPNASSLSATITGTLGGNFEHLVVGTGTATAQIIDATAPTVTITDDEPAATANIAGGNVLYTFTFSEPVTGFVTSDIVVGGGTKGTFTAVSSTVYTLDVIPTANTQAGIITVDVAAGAANDAASNGNTVAIQATQAYDTKAPTVIITDDEPAATANIAGGSVLYTFTTSESVGSTLTIADVTVTGGTVGALTQVGTSNVYNLTVTPTANVDAGTISVTVNQVGITDTAGNSGTGTVNATQAYDTKAPTVSVDIIAPDLPAGGTSQVKFVFSEVPTGFTAADIIVTSGSGSITSGPTIDATDPTGKTYVATFTASSTFVGNATVSVSSGSYTDAALNTGSGGNDTVFEGFTFDAATKENGQSGNFTLSGHYNTGVTIRAYWDVDNPTHAVAVTLNGDGTWSGAKTNLGNNTGAHTFFVVATTGSSTIVQSIGVTAPAGIAGEAVNLGLTDPAGHDGAITLTISDVPDGWTIDGGTRNADGSWTATTTNVSALTVTTPVTYTGAHVLNVTGTWSNEDGTTGTMTIADNVEIYAKGSPIFALSGNDYLTGSSGNDLFVFSQPIGADTVHNFDAAADQIDLIGYNGLADFADLQTHIADDAHGNAVITLGDGQSITLDGVHSGALTAGNFVFDQTPVVNNAGTMTIGDGALLPLSGMINNSGLISLDSTGGETLLQIIQHGVTLQGGGQILLSDSAANVISGTGPDVTLVNVDNTISGAGQLGGGMLSLDNQGTIIASGANALVIDTGGSVVTNSGTLEATGSGGLTITGGLANSGMLLANGGDIVIHGQVTGDGDATIGNLSKLEFGSASSTDVTFAHDAAGTLQLDDSFDFSGRIGGITNDDRLELEDILFGAGTTAVYQANQDGSGGTLTVSDGTHGTALHLVGSYDANGFKLADDGQGHTAVSYNPAEFTLTGVGNGAISSDFVV